jgi:hypothetical protein
MVILSVVAEPAGAAIGTSVKNERSVSCHDGDFAANCQDRTFYR